MSGKVPSTSKMTAPGCRSAMAGSPYGVDDLPGRLNPELLKQLALLAGPPDQAVEPAGVEPLVGVGESAQRAPARCLAFHAQPQQLKLLQAAERGPGQQVPVELQPAFSPIQPAHTL